MSIKMLGMQVKSRRLKQLHWDKIKTPQQGTVWAKEQPQVNLNLTELENLFQVRPLPARSTQPLCLSSHPFSMHHRPDTSPLP